MPISLILRSFSSFLRDSSYHSMQTMIFVRLVSLLCVVYAQVPSQDPSLTPSLLPTLPPSQSMVPTSTSGELPTPNPTQCYDVTGWEDAAGDGCDWYSDHGNLNRCHYFGNEYKNEGHVAITACCICSGGINAAFQPSSVPTNTPSLTPSDFRSCIDDENFVDADGFTCLDYERDLDDDALFSSGETRCSAYGEVTGADEYCCACGGGYYEPRVPSSSPSVSHLPSILASSVSPTVRTCVSSVGWVDTYGSDCSSYVGSLSDNTTRCEAFGGTGFNFGLTASQACCECSGGGYQLSENFYPRLENPKPRPLEPSLNQVGEACIDVPNWNVTTVGATCEQFYFKKTNTTVSCDDYGHIIDEYSVSAWDACCICGGGYNGTLIGKTIRVTFTTDADTGFTLYTNPGADSIATSKNGSIPSFLTDVAEAKGLGLENTYLSSRSQEMYPNDTYLACTADLVASETDICVGHTWNVDERTLNSESLFLETFHLVVPLVDESFWEKILTPFMPFSGLAWVCLVFIVLYMSVGFNIIQKKSMCSKSRPTFRRLCSAVYYGVLSFTSGSAEYESKDLPQRLLTLGFAVFALIILTAYTATMAAFLVSADSGYTSLEDVVSDSARICLQGRVSGAFAAEHPQASSLVSETFFNTSELLDAVLSGECDTVLVSSTGYDQSTLLDDTYCSGIKILLDEVTLEIDVVITINPRLGSWGDELVASINEYIERGMYMVWHNYFLENNPTIPDEETNRRRRRLKASSSATTSLIDGGSSTYSCGEETTVDYDTAQLDYSNIVFPIVVSFWCTTIGLCVFFCSEKYRVGIKHRIGTSMNRNFLNEEEDEVLLRISIEEMDPDALYRRLREMDDVNREDLINAVNSLPDKIPLVDLCFLHSCSKNSSDKIRINELSVFEMCELLDWFAEMLPDEICVDNGDLAPPKWSLSALNDSDDPKGELVETIMQSPKVRRTALYCVHEKQRIGGEIFSVLEAVKPSDLSKKGAFSDSEIYGRRLSQLINNIEI